MARTWRAFGLTGCAVLLLAPTLARAQYPMARVPGTAPGGDATAPTRGMGAINANPFTNPYMNPFMNPYAGEAISNNGVTPSQAAMYFLAAQQANGGIGSGRLSGTRPDPAAARGKAAGTTPEPRRTDANTPGSTASHYFNRSFVSQMGTRRLYNRQNGQYPSNRR
ncbi:MAG: hypothetical protein U0794_18735 [Isosphaeraceae bacterium]